MRVAAEECMDWGGARTKQTVLISGCTCWSQSTFPCRLGFWHWIPNRDYPYQGLTHVLENGENWKFLDGLGIGIEGVELVPKEVTLTPERAEYSYCLAAFPDTPALSTEFSIDSSNSSGVLIIRAFKGLGGMRNFSIMPVVDIRHMYAPSRPFSHRAGSAKSAILAELDGKIVAVKRMNGPAVSITAGHVFDWHYKLGSGFRTHTPDGIRFSGESRGIFVPGSLVFPIQPGESYEVRVLFGDSKKEAPLQHYVGTELPGMPQIERLVNTDSTSESEREALVGRIFGASRMLSSFGRNTTLMPYAGEWWFKTVWFRDAFEGLLNNLQTYHMLGLDNVTEEAVLSGLALQDESGRIPTKLPENDATAGGLNYESADAGLLCINLGLEYARLSGKKNVMTMSVFGLERMIESFEKNAGRKDGDGGRETENGPPILSKETGLISCVPWQSWTDSRPYGISSRVPLSWAHDFGASELSKPKYLLPEINAQFLRALHTAINDCDRILITNARRKALEEIFEKSCASFRKTFWNDGAKFINNAVRDDGEAVVDATFGSPAIVSAALLEGFLFKREELNAILESAFKTILARRTPVLFGTEAEKASSIPFGLLVKDSYERGGAYLGDEQYHARVIWPRDNPYLSGLARLCGREDIARAVLLNTLDHQQSEGAVFYTQELFSQAEGHNPSPSGNSGNPVPVKNPVQFWSQYCDAYIKGYDFWTRQKKWIAKPVFTLH